MGHSAPPPQILVPVSASRLDLFSPVKSKKAFLSHCTDRNIGQKEGEGAA